MTTPLVIFATMSVATFVVKILLALWLSHPACPVDADRFLYVLGKLLSFKLPGQLAGAWKSIRPPEAKLLSSSQYDGDA